jgi:hypothetical protein
MSEPIRIVLQPLKHDRRWRVYFKPRADSADP